jgi:hypothetical protein
MRSTSSLHLGQLRERLVVGVGECLVARPAADIVEVDLDDGAEILLGLADHDRFLDEFESFSAFSISEGAMFLPPR